MEINSNTLSSCRDWSSAFEIEGQCSILSSKAEKEIHR